MGGCFGYARDATVAAAQRGKKAVASARRLRLVAALPGRAPVTVSTIERRKRMLLLRRVLSALLLPLLLLSAVPAAPAQAEGASTPVATIEGFYQTLLAVMKEARSLPFDERYRRLEPAIRAAFDLGLMTRIAIGPEWTGLRPEQQQRLVDAFTRYTVSVYASRFDDYAGERFEVAPQPSENSAGVVVQSWLIKSNGERISLNYLLRQEAGEGWQVMDVYLSGAVSELATRRSEFVAVLRRDGADGLVRSLDQRAAALRTG